MQDDLAYSLNVILGILEEKLFKCTDIERGKERDRDQQDNTGSEGELADQTLIKRPE